MVWYHVCTVSTVDWRCCTAHSVNGDRFGPFRALVIVSLTVILHVLITSYDSSQSAAAVVLFLSVVILIESFRIAGRMLFATQIRIQDSYAHLDPGMIHHISITVLYVPGYLRALWFAALTGTNLTLFTLVLTSSSSASSPSLATSAF